MMRTLAASWNLHAVQHRMLDRAAIRAGADLVVALVPPRAALGMPVRVVEPLVKHEHTPPGASIRTAQD